MKKNRKNANQQSHVEKTQSGGFKVSWLLWGVAAYYGLKFLNKRGILPEQTGKALNWIDHGIDVAKQRAGFGSAPSSISTNY